MLQKHAYILASKTEQNGKYVVCFSKAENEEENRKVVFSPFPFFFFLYFNAFNPGFFYMAVNEVWFWNLRVIIQDSVKLITKVASQEKNVQPSEF